jgi:hypothetical protein
MLEIAESAREKVDEMLSRVDRSHLSTGARSKSLLGLPLRRAIPQDVHSIIDYAGAAAGLFAALAARTARARAANAALSMASTGVSALTDYKLSLAKVIPIEVHEAVDYVWGLSNILTPFALGYFRKDKTFSLMQIALGTGTIAASLFTDYRAFSRNGSTQAKKHAPSNGKTRAAKKKKS